MWETDWSKVDKASDSENIADRLKIFYVSEDEIMSVVTWHDQMPSVLRIPDKPSGIPDGAKVLRVCHQWNMRAFGFLVQHESFDVVPKGEIPPNVSDQMHLCYKLIARGEDGAYRLPE